MNAFIFSFLSLFCFLTCENKSLTDESPGVGETFTRDQKELANARKLVENFGRMIGVTTKSSSPLTITLDEVKTLTCDQPVTKSVAAADSVNLYTFTLEKDGKNGFAIACGDERVADVYAYVEEGDLSDTTYIPGMAQYIRDIPEYCTHDLQYCEANEALTKCSPPDYYCNDAFNSSPLVQTQWQQGQPYNWGTPGDVCDYYHAGCGVIALAQIVAYYKKCDRNFNFDILTKYPKIYTTLSSEFTHEVSEFVKYIGSLCYAEYSCSDNPGTVTYYDPCLNVFRRLGYDYISEEEVSMIDYNKLNTCISKKNIVFAFGRDVNQNVGHFWVIDGYFPILTKCDATKIHCNWGWAGKSDGWYTDATFMDNYTSPWNEIYKFNSYKRYCYLNVNK